MKSVMADGGFVVNAPLCFLVNKFGRLDNKLLKSLLSDYYSTTEIVIAKDQLTEDACSLHFEDKIPRLSSHREGDGRHSREVNDLFTIVTALDENQLISHMPKYVVDKPDMMPSARLSEGDLKCFMHMFEKLEEKFDLYREEVCTLSRSVHSALSRHTAVQCDINKVSRPAGGHSTADAIAHVTDRSAVTRTNVNTVVQVSANDQPAMNWAGENQFVSTESETCDDDRDGDWSVMMSRRSKRRRTRSSQQRPGSGAETPGGVDEFPPLPSSTPGRSVVHATAVRANQPTGNRYAAAVTAESTLNKRNAPRRSGKKIPMMIGTKSATGVDYITAAKPYVSKAVYCIDNVSTTVGVDIMQAFIGQNGVTVLSCHSVKPRRSWWQREAGVFPKGRNTFRVCIPREQRDKLLKPDIWPSHITITPWIFTKKRAQTQETDVDRRTSQSDHDVGPTAAGTNQQGSTAVTSLLPTVDNNRTANNDAEGTDRDMESETTITDYYNDDA